jgi:hypothetical protein
MKLDIQGFSFETLFVSGSEGRLGFGTAVGDDVGDVVGDSIGDYTLGVLSGTK